MNLQYLPAKKPNSSTNLNQKWCKFQIFRRNQLSDREHIQKSINILWTDSSGRVLKFNDFLSPQEAYQQRDT